MSSQLLHFCIIVCLAVTACDGAEHTGNSMAVGTGSHEGTGSMSEPQLLQLMCRCQLCNIHMIIPFAV